MSRLGGQESETKIAKTNFIAVTADDVGAGVLSDLAGFRNLARVVTKLAQTGLQRLASS